MDINKRREWNPDFMNITREVNLYFVKYTPRNELFYITRKNESMYCKDEKKEGRMPYETPVIHECILILEMGLAQQTVVTSATDGGYENGGTLPGQIGDGTVVGGGGDEPGFGGFN
ncbi:MAG: hypothetical protein LBN29_07885 [Mediterranea sp.]|nr:hypothetical protein [Mediterranea sp.]